MFKFMYSWRVMTQSLTLARLPRADENSKPPVYRQKMKDLSKRWVLTGNSLKSSNEKKNRNKIIEL